MHFQINNEGVEAIGKNKAITTVMGLTAGAAILAAYFFVLKRYGANLFRLDQRVGFLEHDRLCEAYKQQGYDVD